MGLWKEIVELDKPCHAWVCALCIVNVLITCNTKNLVATHLTRLRLRTFREYDLPIELIRLRQKTKRTLYFMKL